MNLPNKLTVLRMILVPFFVFFLLAEWMPHHYLFALILFCTASYTDHLDGQIARKQNLVTNFGKFMDPLADKILVISALVCFAGACEYLVCTDHYRAGIYGYFHPPGCRRQRVSHCGKSMGKSKNGQPASSNHPGIGDAVCPMFYQRGFCPV